MAAAPIEVRLYDTNGAHTGGMTVDEEPNREGLVSAGGKTYLWNQRNNQWREVVATASGSFQKREDESAAPKAPKGEASPSAGAGEKAK